MNLRKFRDMQRVVLQQLFAAVNSADFRVCRSDSEPFAYVPNRRNGRVYASDVQDWCDVFHALVEGAEEVRFGALKR